MIFEATRVEEFNHESYRLKRRSAEVIGLILTLRRDTGKRKDLEQIKELNILMVW